LLGNPGWHSRAVFRPGADPETLNTPLWNSLEEWWTRKGQALAGQDRLGLVQALVVLQTANPWHYRQNKPARWKKALRKELFGDLDLQTLQYRHVILGGLFYLLEQYGAADLTDYLLAASEHTLASIPRKEVNSLPQLDDSSQRAWTWRKDRSLFGWMDLTRQVRRTWQKLWLPEHHGRLYRLLRWLDEPAKGWPRQRPDLEMTLAAHQAGQASEADLLDVLVQEPAHYRIGELWQVSGYLPHPLAQKYPILNQLIPRIRERILAIELQRGDLPTAASLPARSLRYAGGMDVLFQLLVALGPANFVRGYAYGSVGKSATFSRLIQATLPGG
jgi:hypothetical protein